MDILRTWIDEDTGKEKAKIYYNIDPESITIVGLEIYFAHPGSYTPGGNTACMYRIPIKGCPYITSDKEQIKAYVTEHPETINAGIYISEIKLYGKTRPQRMNPGLLPGGGLNSQSPTGYKELSEKPESYVVEENQQSRSDAPKLTAYKKSLDDAKCIAQKISMEYPDITMIVLDKKGMKATYTASEWIYRERILEGWHTVAKYKNGKLVF